MRYLFSKKEENIKKLRQEYIYEVFNLYTLGKGESDDFIILDTFPIKYLDIFFIVGHDREVYRYLKKNINEIEEKIIVAITCNTEILKEFSSFKKEIYVPKDNCRLTKKYDGSKWGFQFDITDSETNMYNDKSRDVMVKIKNSMINIKDLKISTG